MRYCDGKMGPFGLDFSGSSHMTELQILMEDTVMIRRLKKDVLDQLPGKERSVRHTPFVFQILLSFFSLNL